MWQSSKAFLIESKLFSTICDSNDNEVYYKVYVNMITITK